MCFVPQYIDFFFCKSVKFVFFIYSFTKLNYQNKWCVKSSITPQKKEKLKISQSVSEFEFDWKNAFLNGLADTI
jgi:hypothetical protein